MDTNTYMLDGREFELKHYGVKGMKWGVRRWQKAVSSSGYAVGRDRYKSDAEVKRRIGSPDYRHRQNEQATRDRIDRMTGQKMRAKKESTKLYPDSEYEFRQEVKALKKRGGMDFDYEIDRNTGKMTVTAYRDSKGQKIGEEYAKAIMAQAGRERAVRNAATTTALFLGASVVGRMLSG